MFGFIWTVIKYLIAYNVITFIISKVISSPVCSFIKKKLNKAIPKFLSLKADSKTSLQFDVCPLRAILTANKLFGFGISGGCIKIEINEENNKSNLSISQETIAMFLQTLFSSKYELTIDSLPSILTLCKFTQIELSQVTLDIEYKANGEYHGKIIPNVTAVIRLAKQTQSLVVTVVLPNFMQTPLESMNISIPMSDNKENTIVLSLSTILINDVTIFDFICLTAGYMGKCIVQNIMTLLTNYLSSLTENGILTAGQSIKNGSSIIRQKLSFLENINWRAALDFPFDISLINSLKNYDFIKIPQLRDVDFSNPATLQNLKWSDMMDIYTTLSNEGYLPQIETVDNYLKDSNLPSRNMICDYVTNTSVYNAIPPLNELVTFFIENPNDPNRPPENINN